MFHLALYCRISLGSSCWRILEIWSLLGDERTACYKLCPSCALFFYFPCHPQFSLLCPGPSQASVLTSLLLNLKHTCALKMHSLPRVRSSHVPGSVLSALRASALLPLTPALCGAWSPTFLPPPGSRCLYLAPLLGGECESGAGHARLCPVP